MESIPAGVFSWLSSWLLFRQDDELQELRVPRQPSNEKCVCFVMFGFLGGKKKPLFLVACFLLPWERLTWLKCVFFLRHPLPPAELRRREGSPQKKVALRMMEGFFYFFLVGFKLTSWH